MNDNRGFTLIELLAVIVILAIIALIATPIVLNIINDSKDSSTLQSAQFYLDAVANAIAKDMLDGIGVEDGTYGIMKDGNLCLEIDVETCKKGFIEIEVSGEKPNNGTIKIDKGELYNQELRFDNEIVLYEGEKLIKFTNPIFNSRVTYSYSELLQDDVIKGIDNNKILDKKNYKLTITNENKEDISFEVMSEIGESEGMRTVLLANKAHGFLLCVNDECFPFFDELSIENGNNLKLEYLNQDVYPHVVRAEDTYVRLFSTELEEGTVTVEYSDSLGNVQKYENVPVRNNSYHYIMFGNSTTYNVVKNGGTFKVKLIQGNKIIEIDANDLKYNTEDDCWDSDYYYYGNNKLGYLSGC